MPIISSFLLFFSFTVCVWCVISSFGLPSTNDFIFLGKNQVFINFAKDQKSYETADTSSQGSTISVDSQDDRLEP